MISLNARHRKKGREQPVDPAANGGASLFVRAVHIVIAIAAIHVRPVHCQTTAEHGTVAIEELFVASASLPGDAIGTLSPDGQIIYYVAGNAVALMRWDSKDANVSEPTVAACAQEANSDFRKVEARGEYVLVASCGMIRLLDSHTLQLKRELRVDAEYRTTEISSSPDGRWLAVGSVSRRDPSESRLYLFDLTVDGQPFSLGSFVGEFAFSGNSKHLSVHKERLTKTGERTGWLESLTIPQGKVMRSWTLDTKRVVFNGMWITPVHPYTVVTGSGSRTLSVCNVLVGKVVLQVTAPEKISNVLLDPTGRLILAAGPTTTDGGTHPGLQVWEARSGVALALRPKESLHFDEMLALSNDGRYLLALRDRRPIIWRLNYVPDSQSPQAPRAGGTATGDQRVSPLR